MASCKSYYPKIKLVETDIWGLVMSSYSCPPLWLPRYTMHYLSYTQKIPPSAEEWKTLKSAPTFEACSKSSTPNCVMQGYTCHSEYRQEAHENIQPLLGHGNNNSIPLGRKKEHTFLWQMHIPLLAHWQPDYTSWEASLLHCLLSTIWASEHVFTLWPSSQPLRSGHRERGPFWRLCGLEAQCYGYRERRLQFPVKAIVQKEQVLFWNYLYNC